MQCRCDATEVWLTKICLYSHCLIGQMISDEFKHSKTLQWFLAHKGARTYALLIGKGNLLNGKGMFKVS